MKLKVYLENGTMVSLMGNFAVIMIFTIFVADLVFVVNIIRTK